MTITTQGTRATHGHCSKYLTIIRHGHIFHLSSLSLITVVVIFTPFLFCFYCSNFFSFYFLTFYFTLNEKSRQMIIIDIFYGAAICLSVSSLSKGACIKKQTKLMRFITIQLSNSINF